MNELELKEVNKEHILYTYNPEGKGDAGEIEYKISSARAKGVRQSANDISGRYAHKAELKVEECVGKNNLPMKFIQAWC